MGKAKTKSFYFKERMIYAVRTEMVRNTGNHEIDKCMKWLETQEIMETTEGECCRSVHELTGQRLSRLKISPDPQR